jgi:hypothetical protein
VGTVDPYQTRDGRTPNRTSYGVAATGPLALRALTYAVLGQVRPWFADPDTQHFLGGEDWPGRMLELGEQLVGQEFRGAVQTGAYHYLATRDDRAVGYIDCGTFDRWAVYDGDHPGDPIRETVDVSTGYLALCVDPVVRSASSSATGTRPARAGVCSRR